MDLREPRHHVLLIGIDAYPKSPLRGAVNDIDAIENLFINRLRVPPQSIQRFAAPPPGASVASQLPSLPPTRDNLRRALSALATDQVGPEDLVFIYYAGHATQIPTICRGVISYREALVPGDIDLETGANLLFDYELHDLLDGIAARRCQLTVVFDCCHAGSVARDAAESDESQSQTRWLPMPASIVIPAGWTTEPRRGLFPAAWGSRPYFILAACQRHQQARESMLEGRFLGVLTRGLAEALRPLTDAQLREATWLGIWRELHERVTTRNRSQTPIWFGPLSRRLFSRSEADADAGLRVTRQGSAYEVEGGELLGLTAGAMVEVFGPDTILLPPVGDAQCKRERLAVILIERAESTRAWGRPERPFNDAGARARLLAYAPSSSFRIKINPWDEKLAGELAAARGLQLLRPDEGAPDLWIRRCPAGGVAVGDDLHRVDGAASCPPFVWLSEEQLSAGWLLPVTLHLMQYAAPLAAAARVQDHPCALRIVLLDGGPNWPTPQMPDSELQDPIRSELPVDPLGCYRISEGTRACIAVDNYSSEQVKVLFLFNCTASGVVEFLGKDGIPGAVAPASRGRHVFWDQSPPPTGPVDANSKPKGQPFVFEIGPRHLAPGHESYEAVDRLVAIGFTSDPEVDLTALEVHQSLYELLRSPQDKGTARGTAREAMSQSGCVSCVLPVRIIRSGPSEDATSSRR